MAGHVASIGTHIEEERAGTRVLVHSRAAAAAAWGPGARLGFQGRGATWLGPCLGRAARRGAGPGLATGLAEEKAMGLRGSLGPRQVAGPRVVLVCAQGAEGEGGPALQVGPGQGQAGPAGRERKGEKKRDLAQGE